MPNINDLHCYPLRAADMLHSYDEMTAKRHRLGAVSCGTGGPRGPDDEGDEKWKREVLELVRATHAMVSALRCCADLQRHRSRGSAGERPLH